jgi:signal transduction histidine kinase
MTTEILAPAEFEKLLSIRPEALSSDDTAATMPDTSLLQQLASLDRSLLADLFEEERYAPREIIFREGKYGETAYLIWSGQVAVVKGTFDNPTLLGYRGPGEIVGEMALLEKQPRSASVIALESLRLLKISYESFQNMLISAPPIGLSVMKLLSARLRTSDNILASQAIFEKRMSQRVSELEAEKQELLETQRLRQDTSDLIIHDLRNPLASMFGVISMLEVVLPEDVLQANHDLIEIAKSSYRRLQRLIDSLLDVSKLESGEAPLNLAPTDLQFLIKETARRLSLTLKSSGIDLILDIPHPLPILIADEERIDRVLGNLVDNALKFSPKGGKVILSALVEQEQVKVSVTDNGPGIPRVERERIFERFSQASSTKNRRRGFGLGLTFCRLAIIAHGGDIWVEDGESGAGSRFIFTLPITSRSEVGQ